MNKVIVSVGYVEDIMTNSYVEELSFSSYEEAVSYVKNRQAEQDNFNNNLWYNSGEFFMIRQIN